MGGPEAGSGDLSSTAALSAQKLLAMTDQALERHKKQPLAACAGHNSVATLSPGLLLGPGRAIKVRGLAV